jgi:hypothetical protein
MGVLWAAQDRELVGGWGRGGSFFQKLRFLICAVFTLSILYISVFYFRVCLLILLFATSECGNNALRASGWVPERTLLHFFRVCIARSLLDYDPHDPILAVSCERDAHRTSFPLADEDIVGCRYKFYCRRRAAWTGRRCASLWRTGSKTDCCRWRRPRLYLSR